VEGPNSGEVDDSASTTVTVGTPAPPVPPSPKLKLTKATASHRHGVTIAGTTVSGFTGKLVVSAACGSATTRHSTTARRRRFASSMRLPSGCRAAKHVKLTVAWAGSSAFSKQTVSRSVPIAR
jgi:hypothetical protein